MASITRIRWWRYRRATSEGSSISGRSAPVAKYFSNPVTVSPSLRSLATTPASSVRGGHQEVGFRRHAARGPALGDGLGAGEEAHPVHAVLVEVAEARALPAAEAVVP